VRVVGSGASLRLHPPLRLSPVGETASKVGELARFSGVAPIGVSHRGVHGVPGIGQVLRREPAEAGPRAGDDDRGRGLLQVRDLMSAFAVELGHDGLRVTAAGRRAGRHGVPDRGQVVGCQGHVQRAERLV
jgi:hypothetical protein